MADVDGLETRRYVAFRKVILKGDAEMEKGDTSLLIDIPPEHQATPGKVLEIRWFVSIAEPDDAGVLAYLGLFEAQYLAMTEAEYLAMPE